MRAGHLRVDQDQQQQHGLAEPAAQGGAKPFPSTLNEHLTNGRFVALVVRRTFMWTDLITAGGATRLHQQ